MYRLNETIKFMIEKKIEEDDKWRKLKIIFSGSDVPGKELFVDNF